MHILLFLLLAVSAVFACPLLVEVFSDPVDVSDQEGEFVEIRLDSTVQEPYLWLQFEDKKPVRYFNFKADRLVLVHDTLQCPVPHDDGTKPACGVLSVSLPNSRESYWKLWTGGGLAGDSVAQSKCLDSAMIPKPKAGASLQRVKETDRWEVAEPTPGMANSFLEFGIVAEVQNSLDLFIDSLLALGISPLVISEVHHCPQEPEPEWVEVYNSSSQEFPLKNFRFCDRGGIWSSNKSDSKAQDLIQAYETVLFTKDSLGLREFLGYKDVRIVQLSMGYLNNTAGSLAICYGNKTIDRVEWDKSTVACPAGFNPQTRRAENTPGYQGRQLKDTPFSYKLSSRVVSRRGGNLRVYVEGEKEVDLKLLDSSGRKQWRMSVPAMSNTWWTVPLEKLPKTGLAYISLSFGKFEKVVGFVVRP